MDPRSPALGGASSLVMAQNQPQDEQSRWLADALAAVKRSAFFMNKAMDEDDLREALRHAAAMLGELRTSLLAPKTYFELHLRVTSELDGLSRYFVARARRGAAAAREAKRQRGLGTSSVNVNNNNNNVAAAVNAGPPAPTSLAALYDLVQHAGNVLPRLYLLATVGAARARQSNERDERRKRRRRQKKKQAPATADKENVEDDEEDEELDKEPSAGAILADVAEMCRGVQHPVRGLFLRAYLLRAATTTTTTTTSDGGGGVGVGVGGVGSVSVSALPRGEAGARFLLSNFAEANKLWVRLGYLTGGGGSSSAAVDAAAAASSATAATRGGFVSSGALASVANTTAGAARAAREAERRQLADLVGKNITLLSQLEMEGDDGGGDGGGGGDEGQEANGNGNNSNGNKSDATSERISLYQRLVLPSLLEQVVGCRDAAAQAYLMQAVVQCFPDDHHVATLDAVLAALPALAPGAKVAGVFGALLDRLARAAVERAEKKDKASSSSSSGAAAAEPSSTPSSRYVLPADGAFDKLADGAASIAARAPDLPAADVAALYAALARYARALPAAAAAGSSSSSSSSLPRVDAALAACRAALDARGGLPRGDRAAAAAVGALLCLPLEDKAAVSTSNTASSSAASSSPSSSSPSSSGVEATLSLPAFPALLAALPRSERRRVAAKLASAVVASEKPISDAGSVATLLRFVAPLVRSDGGQEKKKKKEAGGEGAEATTAEENDAAENEHDDDDDASSSSYYDDENFDDEQNLVARMIHRLRSDADVDAHYAILGAASEALASGGAARATRVLPPLAFSALDVAARAAAAGAFGDEGGPRRPPAAPPGPGQGAVEATARGALQFVSKVASRLAEAGQAMAASAAAAEERERGWGAGGGGGDASSSTTSTARKAAAAADAVSAALGIRLAAATLAAAHPRLADDASDAFEQAFLLYEEACPPDSASQRAALRSLTAALSSAAAAASAAAASAAGEKDVGLSRESFDALAAKAASCASRLLRKADQCRALCAVAHVYWRARGIRGGSGSGSGGGDDDDDDDNKAAASKSALSCMQRALRAATAASSQAAVARRTSRGRGGAVEAAALHVEVLDHYLRFAAAGARGFDDGDSGENGGGNGGTLSALLELVAGEVVGSEEPAVRGDKELVAFYESTLQRAREGGYGGGGEAVARLKALKL